MRDVQVLEIELGVRVLYRLETLQRDMRWWYGIWPI